MLGSQFMSFSFCIDILHMIIHITEKGIKHISKEKNFKLISNKTRYIKILSKFKSIHYLLVTFPTETRKL